MKKIYRSTVAAVALIGLSSPTSADVISDWNEKAVAFVVASSMAPPPASRVLAMTHLAMFDAVNSIDGRYRPYLVQVPSPAGTSQDAAAATAAGHILASVDPKTEPAMKAALAAYLATLPEGSARQEGIKLGEAVAAKHLQARANDNSRTLDTYRPRVAAGTYAPTVPPVVSHWPGVMTFTMASGDLLRPEPPIVLTSAQWAADYNEIKELGARDSTKRTARQTEDARFWLATDGRVYYPLVKTVAAARKMPVIDSARLYALTAAAWADALIAVWDAKYHYNFWRPMTAIRNGDIDDNPATERDAAWMPIDATPMHPEYPCAHCIVSAAVGSVLETVLGTPEIPEVAFSSPTLPGVIHRWSSVRDFYNEVAEARIWAGFHYRFSTRIGQEMGIKIGANAATKILVPIAVTTR